MEVMEAQTSIQVNHPDQIIPPYNQGNNQGNNQGFNQGYNQGYNQGGYIQGNQPYNPGYQGNQPVNYAQQNNALFGGPSMQQQQGPIYYG